MAKNDAKESARLRTLRIDGSQNGATLRTRIVRDKTKYTRTLKHKKSLADAGDFPFIFCRTLLRHPSGSRELPGNLSSLVFRLSSRMSRATFARFR